MLPDFSRYWNGFTSFPEEILSLKNLRRLNKNVGLKIKMGNNYLKIKDQQKLRSEYPNIEFNFEDTYDGESKNEEK